MPRILIDDDSPSQLRGLRRIALEIFAELVEKELG